MVCSECKHEHAGTELASICIGCPCPRRCSSKPDISGGKYERVRPIDDEFEVVTYDTTPEGAYALHLYDRRRAS